MIGAGVIADTFITETGPTSGATVYAYEATRFLSVPIYGSQPPAGAPDAGPVTTGTQWGGAGQFQLTVPNNVNYYALCQYDNNNYWQLVQPVDAGGGGGGGGGGGLDSFTSPMGTINIGGTLTDPTVDVATASLYQLPTSYISGADMGATLNALLVTLAASGGAHVVIPVGFISTSIPIVMQQSIWLDGPGPQAGGIVLLPGSNCDVLQYQCYIADAPEWISGHSYTGVLSDVITYTGAGGVNQYYLCQAATGASTVTPDIDFYHWTCFSPVPVGVPPRANLTKVSNLLLSMGGVSTQAPGDCHHCHNFAASSYDWTGLVDSVRTFQSTGDGFHTTYGGILTANTIRYNMCYADHNKITGWQASYDTIALNMHVGYNHVGGVLLPANDILFDGQVYNNGYTPAFMPATSTDLTITTESGGSGFTLRLTSGFAYPSGFSAVDLVNQGVYDGAYPGDPAGYIPAGTWIRDVTGLAVVDGVPVVYGTLSQPAGGPSGYNLSTTVTVGGYYIQSTSPGIFTPDAVISVENGNLYFLLTDNPYGLTTDPSSDTTNWRRIRFAPEWGWGMTIWSGLGGQLSRWNSLRGNSQAHPRGAVQVFGGANTNRIDVTAQQWLENPITGTVGVSQPLKPTGLSDAALLGIDGSQNIISMVAANPEGATLVGCLLNWTAGSGNIVNLTSDSNYLYLFFGEETIPGGNYLNFNGAYPAGV
jgi:hypothetical protein